MARRPRLNADVAAAIVQSQVIAIVRQRQEDVEAILETGRALVAAGLPVVEVTLNTPGALTAIGRLADEVDAIIGAGTVLTTRDVDAVADAGGRFVVSPDVQVGVIERAAERGLLSLPGACTPTEVRHALDAGADLVKLFPAGPLGVSYLSALRGPFPDVPFVPTGGIGLGDVVEYLGAGATAVGLGSSLVGGTPREVADRARRLIALKSRKTG